MSAPRPNNRTTTPKPLIVAGLMSGTSADGVDVAFCRIRPSADGPKLDFLAHHSTPYPKALKRAVLAAMDSSPTTTPDLARLHWHLGSVYADALEAAIAATGVRPQLIALHGQTIYHQATAAPYLGKPTRATWQIGEPSVLAERLKLPVVSDFRPADLAAGGQGAPLVPMLDFLLYRSLKKNRILLNLGGIANMTAVPAGASAEQLLAFDSGPANMVVDALMQLWKNRPYDRGGSFAKQGKILPKLLEQSLANVYFKELPPKSCGREQFGSAYVEKFAETCAKASPKPADGVATATALTADSILQAYAHFIQPHFAQTCLLASGTEVIAAGGGVHNATLMQRLTEGFARFNIPVKTTADLGLPTEAKEAAAFALLGWLTWNHLPGNIPSATGAHHPALLGKITLA